MQEDRNQDPNVVYKNTILNELKSMKYDKGVDSALTLAAANIRELLKKSPFIPVVNYDYRDGKSNSYTQADMRMYERNQGSTHDMQSIYDCLRMVLEVRKEDLYKTNSNFKENVDDVLQLCEAILLKNAAGEAATEEHHQKIAAILSSLAERDKKIPQPTTIEHELRRNVTGGQASIDLFAALKGSPDFRREIKRFPVVEWTDLECYPSLYAPVIEMLCGNYNYEGKLLEGELLKSISDCLTQVCVARGQNRYITQADFKKAVDDVLTLCHAFLLAKKIHPSSVRCKTDLEKNIVAFNQIPQIKEMLAARELESKAKLEPQPQPQPQPQQEVERLIKVVDAAQIDGGEIPRINSGKAEGKAGASDGDNVFSSDTGSEEGSGEDGKKIINGDEETDVKLTTGYTNPAENGLATRARPVGEILLELNSDLGKIVSLAHGTNKRRLAERYHAEAIELAGNPAEVDELIVNPLDPIKNQPKIDDLRRKIGIATSAGRAADLHELYDNARLELAALFNESEKESVKYNQAAIIYDEVSRLLSARGRAELTLEDASVVTLALENTCSILKNPAPTPEQIEAYAESARTLVTTGSKVLKNLGIAMLVLGAVLAVGALIAAGFLTFGATHGLLAAALFAGAVSGGSTSVVSLFTGLTMFFKRKCMGTTTRLGYAMGDLAETLKKEALLPSAKLKEDEPEVVVNHRHHAY